MLPISDLAHSRRKVLLCHSTRKISRGQLSSDHLRQAVSISNKIKDKGQSFVKKCDTGILYCFVMSFSRSKLSTTAILWLIFVLGNHNNDAWIFELIFLFVSLSPLSWNPPPCLPSSVTLIFFDSASHWPLASS